MTSAAPVATMEPVVSDHPSQRPGPIPWRARDLTRWTLGTWVGLIVIVVAWFGASGSAELDVQYRWLNLGVAGAVIVGTANIVWLLNGVRAVRERRHEILAALLAEASPSEEVPDHLESRDDVLVAAPKMTRYHRADCPLVAGKAAAEAGLRAHRAAGRRPCGVCRSAEGAATGVEVAA